MAGRRRTLLLYVVVLATAAALLIPMMRKEQETAMRSQAVPSTYLAGKRGLRALYLVLRESGAPVARQRGPLTRLPEGPNRMLVLAGPSRRGVTSLEAAELRIWVSEGNTLVWLSGESWPGQVPVREQEVARVLEAPGYGSFGLPYAEAQGDRFEIPVPGDTAYGDGVDLLVVPAREDPASPLSLSDMVVEEEEEEPQPLPPSRWVPIAGTLYEGAVVLKQRLGEGEVFLLPSTRLLDNDGISRADNLDFFLGIVELHEPVEILFDEYHHGYEPHPLAGLARNVWFRTLVWQAVGLFLLYAAARIWRMGPPRPYSRDDRRPAADYVRALGNLFRKGRKAPDVAGSLRRSFLARLEHRMGLPPRGGLPESEEDRRLAVILEQRSGVKAARLAPLLDAAREGRTKGERELLELARSLRRVEEEVDQWRKG